MLKDTFGRAHTYLRISIAERCNLRCIYCMPKEGITLSPATNLLNKDEIVRLSKIFVNMGVKKIRLTGGEPSLNKDLKKIISSLNLLKQDGLEDICLTSNGAFLYRHIKDLKNCGLDMLNISLDTLTEEKYLKVTGFPYFRNVLKTLAVSQDLSLKELKINCVVMKGFNEHEIIEFVRLTQFMNICVRFIEFMPFTDNSWSQSKFIPSDVLLELIRKEYSSINQIQATQNSTTSLFQIEGFLGKFGFISSLSNNFCASCNRLRVSATGDLQLCLFGSHVLSIKNLMRSKCSDEEIIKEIKIKLMDKKLKHDGLNLFSPSNIKKKPMILIGG